ncbi:hypothetical protein C8R43DRAFT_965976 [Mycena crocata]|nr:hypothetical protein C8R43DRAFT_965976 [Mycena crocata]
MSYGALEGEWPSSVKETTQLRRLQLGWRAGGGIPDRGGGIGRMLGGNVQSGTHKTSPRNTVPGGPALYDAPTTSHIVHSIRQVRKTLWLPSEVARMPRNLEQCTFRLLFPHYALICSHPRKYSTPALPKPTMTRVTRSHGPAPTPPQEVVKSRSGKRKKKTPAAPNPEAQEATAAGVRRV